LRAPAGKVPVRCARVSAGVRKLYVAIIRDQSILPFFSLCLLLSLALSCVHLWNKRDKLFISSQGLTMWTKWYWIGTMTRSSSRAICIWRSTNSWTRGSISPGYPIRRRIIMDILVKLVRFRSHDLIWSNKVKEACTKSSLKLWSRRLQPVISAR